jgi:hypothetical protein
LHTAELLQGERGVALIVVAQLTAGAHAQRRNPTSPTGKFHTAATAIKRPSFAFQKR